MGSEPQNLAWNSAGSAGEGAFERELGGAGRPHDPLLDCLVELTRYHGRPSTAAALAAGLPLDARGLTPSLFARAASRAGFASKVVRRPLERIDRALLPVILLLKGDHACILLGWDEAGENASVLLPESGQGSVSLPRGELELRYTGVAIFARPHFRFDRRTPELGQVAQRHWFWSAFFEQLPVYKDVLIAAFLINMFALALPVFTMNVYDRIVPNHAEETLWMLAAGMLLVVVLDYVIRLIRSHFVDLAGQRIDLQISSRIMEKVLGMRMADRPSSVGAFAATLRSFESVRDFMASATVTTLIDLPFVLLFIGVIGWIAWPVALVPLIGGILILIYSYVVQHRMHALAETTFRASALRNATLVESLTALETIKSHGAEKLMQSRWEKSAAFLARTSGEMRLLSTSATSGVAALQQLINVIVVVLGVYLIYDRQMSMGGLIACTVLSSRTIAPLGQVVGLLMQYQNARMALTSLEGHMNRPGERSDPGEFVHRPHIKGEIEFRKVAFHYPGQDNAALKNVSFTIKPGEHVVVIGRIGSGKTTLQKLIMGLYTPNEGAVLVDGIDVRQLDPADLRSNVGYVEQDPLLFYGTLRDNISIAAPYADDRAVVAAAEVGLLADFVNKHPSGFDMLIGERGETLSGGQRQGVSIARAALIDPPILLLDEPTSSMDYSSEAQFKEALRKFAEHRTMLIVTHRTSLLDLADRLIVLDDGQVVADGPRELVVKALQSGQVGRAR